MIPSASSRILHNRRTVVFERIRLLHIPLLLFHVYIGSKIYFADPDRLIRKYQWLGNKILNDTDAFECIVFNYREYDLVLDIVESYVAQKRFVGKSLQTLFGDRDILDAVKKEVSRYISTYLFIRDSVLERESGEGDIKKLFVFPDMPSMVSRVCEEELKQRGDQSGVIFRVPLWYRFLGMTLYMVLMPFVILGFSIKPLVALCFVCLGKLFPENANEKREFTYAINLHMSNFQFKFKKNRTFDFLIDGNVLNRENTVFFIPDPVSPGVLEQLEEKEYEYFYGYLHFVGGVIQRLSLYVSSLRTYSVQKTAYSLFLLLFGMATLDRQCAKLSGELFFARFKWEMILGRISFKHFISFNDFTPSSICRNIVFKKHAITTWHYEHSNTTGVEKFEVDKMFRLARSWYRSFIHYDNYMFWNHLMRDFFNTMENSIGNRHVIGCVWSSIVKGSSRNRHAKSKYLEMFPQNVEGLPIISFFGTALIDKRRTLYSPESNDISSGVLFVQHILELLEDNTEIRVIFKDKKDPSFYSNPQSQFYTQRHNDLCEVYEKLGAHPRCVIANEDGDTAAIIGISDITAGITFTSPVIEALGAGKKAFYYDPVGKYYGTPYDEAGLIAHEYDELKLRIKRLLYEISDNQYREYFTDTVTRIVDPKCDGNAIERFLGILKEYE